jgi:hypothetical protein
VGRRPPHLPAQSALSSAFMVKNSFKTTRIWTPHYKGGLKITFLLFRRAVPHAQSQSVLAFMAIKPVCSFDACSAQHNYGLDLALYFFERVGFSMDPPRKWTTRFKYAE